MSSHFTGEKNEARRQGITRSNSVLSPWQPDLTIGALTPSVCCCNAQQKGLCSLPCVSADSELLPLEEECVIGRTLSIVGFLSGLHEFLVPSRGALHLCERMHRGAGCALSL